MFTTKKIALVSVINDLVTDNRVNRSCMTLVESGYKVVLIGRKLPASLPLPAWPFKAKRMHLLFKTGPLFYFWFNVRLFFLLLFTRANLLYANDLDTLLPNYLVARLKNIPLIYDSHELFCEVPELQHDGLKRKLWLKLEGWIVPKLKHCITVNESIAQLFEEKYKVKFETIKNIGEVVHNVKPKSRPEMGLPENKKLILLQGAGINIDRGAEELVDAMAFVDGALLLIVGGGDVWPILEQKLKNSGLKEKVRLVKKVPRVDLLNYTYNADLGLSIDKNTNLNYYYSLPNKLFDYLQAGVPVLASRLPEIERIITHYKVGDFIENHNPEKIAAKLNEMLAGNVLNVYRSNTDAVNKELNWNKEKTKLLALIARAGDQQ